jgi:tRNA(Ile)-lysidine synthetase-like protein
MRFYNDTYKKAFTKDMVERDIMTVHPKRPYDPALICDSYPDLYRNPEWSAKGYYDPTLTTSLKPYTRGYVSLSGGVDSMVMLAYLKHLNADVGAIHIIYGNRAESEHEYRFLSKYCNKLKVPLYTYRVPWLRRAEVDRQFYEEMTRQLRFWVYTAIANTNPIFMGHIQDDVVENIWTNIASCTHMGNLKKMQHEETQMSVRIVRPFLNIEKRDIYDASNQLAIPYLKNTTPSWSNRGKFREHFHEATVQQFGPSIDHKIIAFAEAMEKQAKLVRMFLYEPMYASFNAKDRSMDITPAIKADLDASAWAGIFEHVCHTLLDITKPGLPAVRDFCRRLQNKRDSFRMHLKKDLTIDFQHTVKQNTYSIRFL